MNRQESVQNDTMTTTVKPSAKNVCCGIYGLRNKTNDKWYVGQSWNIPKRWNGYKNYDCKAQPKLYKALKRYKYDTFEKRIIEWCDRDIPQEMMDKKEAIWIKHLNSIEHGYNLQTGGFGGKHSDETIAKMRLRRASPETRRKMSETQKRRVFSAEHRQKLSIAGKSPRNVEHLRKLTKSQIGKVLSEDTLQKIRDRRRGQPGHPQTTESREKIRVAQIGRIVSAETRQRIKDNHVGNKGQHHSEETKQKMRTARLAYLAKVKTDLPSCARLLG